MRRLSLAVTAIALLGFAGLTCAFAAEEPVEEPPPLLGRCSVEQLREEPFVEWFDREYDGYVAAPEILEALRAIDREGVTLQLFFGSWCGDSRRELPRLLRLFDQIGFSAEQIELIGVDRGDGVHKQAPGREERGLEIYRVPTLLIRRAGSEIARIVEYPALSLERDLLAILSGAEYEANYRSYPLVRRWLEQGLLSDSNVGARGLAQQLRERVSSEGELAAAARVLLERGELAEGLKLMEVNAALFRESSRALAGLAEARLRVGDGAGAHLAAEGALALNADPEQLAELVELLHRSREQGLPEPPDTQESLESSRAGR